MWWSCGIDGVRVSVPVSSWLDAVVAAADGAVFADVDDDVVVVVNLLVNRSISVNLLCDDWLNRRCNASAEYGLFGSSTAFFHFICSRSAMDPIGLEIKFNHIKCMYELNMHRNLWLIKQTETQRNKTKPNKNTNKWNANERNGVYAKFWSNSILHHKNIWHCMVDMQHGVS